MTLAETVISRHRDESAEIDALIGTLLSAQLSAIGLASGAAPDPQYRSWLGTAIELLAERGHTPGDAGAEAGSAPAASQPWEVWAAARRRWNANGHYVAHARLAESCLRALPDVLSGARRATDVIFPDGSMALVEAVYRNNPNADLLNGLVGEALVAYVRARIARDPGVQLRILEIGAGTGGTTATVLPRLAPFSANIAEYAYTDLSRAFLEHARTHFCPQFPFVTTALFDVSLPIEGQSVGAGQYDVAIGASVLHATSSIRTALRNAKAALRARGLLILNEICARTLFSHVTFGLLPGWWLNRDGELRLPGSPALSRAGWARVLNEEIGRARLPAGNIDGLDQFVVIAESDGVIRQPLAGAASPATGALAADGPAATAAPRGQPDAPGDSPDRLARRIVRECVSAALKLEPTEIQDDRRFSDYGVDSILAIRLCNAINDASGARLSTTDLFDYSSVEEVARHIVEAFGTELAAAQPAAPPNAPPPTTPAPESAPDPRGQCRRIVVTGPGSIDQLELREVPLAPLGPGEVRVAVRAFSLSFGDLLCVKGLYPTMPPYPFTPGVEASGVVSEVGAGVRGFAPGDEVLAMMGESLGAHATNVVCTEEELVRKPESLSFEQACAIAGVAITAIDVFHKAALRPGERILIQTAAGGLGLVAVQLARQAGAEIFATAGSERKIEHLRGLGVHHAINYRERDFADELRRITGGEGVDVVVNTLAGDAVQKGLRCLRAGGRYIELAMTALKSARNIDLSVLSENQTLFSVDLRKLTRAQPQRVQAYRQEMLALLARGVISPTIAEAVDLADFKRAYRLLEARENIGKVVVRVPAEPAAAVDPAAAVEPAVAVETPRRWARGTAAAARDQRDGIAVVGMSGRFAQSDDLDEFWRHLANGDDLVVPVRRWDLGADRQRAAARGKLFCDQGSLLSRVDQFDPLFFNITGLEAASMDPQQRLFLETAWHALEHAGYATERIKGSACGVYVGCSAGDYHLLLGRDRPPQSFWGNAASVIPARISYYLDLTGAAIGVDAACASSLVAIHLACQALRAGEVDCALAGGVFVQCTPGFFRYANEAGMLSPSGRCRTFDGGADGFVPGEGVGAIVLKRLGDAVADRDAIHAVICASGTNQDGSSNGITAPSRQAQIRLAREVYERFGVHPEAIQMVEAHGTGTALGDPIEYEAITRAFRVDTQKSGFCAIGSVKSNIGHAAAAAGIAGVLKTILSLKHRQIPPTLHFRAPNPRIAFADSPFYVNTELREWARPAGGRRRAAVSSFGFSGTNAHVVIEEAPARAPASAGAPAHLVAVSARTSEQLHVRAERLRALCEADATLSMDDVSYTSLVRTRHLKHRLAVVARDRQEMLSRLGTWLAADGEPGVFTGVASEAEGEQERVELGRRRVAEAAAAATAEARGACLARVAELFVAGCSLDFEQLLGDSARHVPLPGYPFARESYWAEAGPATDQAAPGRIHPLLHGVAAEAGGARYTSQFTGGERFFADHRIGGRSLLSGAALLEAARAAAVHALGDAAREGEAIVLSNVVWLNPVAAGGGPVDLAIAVEPCEGGEVVFKVTSGEPAGAPTLHCEGRARSLVLEPRQLDLVALRAMTGDHQWSAEECYTAFRQLGVEYGPSHKAVRVLHAGARQVLAELELPSAARDDDHARFGFDPALLDAALQAGLGLMPKEQQELKIPFALEALDIYGRCPEVAWAWVRARAGRGAEGARLLDVDLCDADGNVCLALRGYAARSAARSPRQEVPAVPAGGVLLEASWRVAPLDRSVPQQAYASRSIVVCEPHRVPVEALRALGGSEIVSCRGTGGDGGERATAALLDLFRHLKAIAAGRPSRPVLTQVLLPRGAEPGLHLAMAALVRAAHHEYPNLIGQVIEVDGGAVAEKVEAERRFGRAMEVRYVGDSRTVRCWNEAREPVGSRVPWRSGGVYLVTGGLGGIGVRLAREIVGSGEQLTLLLVGRSPAGATVDARLRALAGHGHPSARVVYRQADVADVEVMRALVHNAQTEFGGLHGVLHCAGVIRDQLLVDKDDASCEAVLRPKVRGVVALDEATREAPLECFVLFSSVAAPLGSPGQADYGAANAFLQGFASERDAMVRAGRRYGRTVAIAWSLWQEGGMSMSAAGQQEMHRRTGQRAMTTAEGLALLHRALATEHPVCLAAAGDAARIRSALAEADDIPDVPPAPADRRRADGDRQALAIERMRELFCSVLRLPAGEIDPKANLDRYGVDSVMITVLTTRLEEVFGPLSKTLLFEYRTIADLAGYFVAYHADKLLPEARSPEPVQPDPQSGPAAGERSTVEQGVEGIALVGLAGRYPAAPDLETYWHNLRDGKDCITEVPIERWDHRDYLVEESSGAAGHRSKWGGFIDGVDQFDALFFGISPKEAALMDPQERLFLEHAWTALEDAGYTRALLRDSLRGRVGVYAGVMYGEYQLFGAEASLRDQRMAFASSLGSVANRVSYFLDLHGPSMTLDTMCSSSLTALHLACQELKLRRIDMAIAGGVNVTVHPNKYLMLSAGQFLSTRGRCESFGEGGDGYIPGEGVGVAVLKRLSDAHRDGDQIYGVILGTAVNHGGKTNGYSVPNPAAQQAVIREALEDAKIDPALVSYVEAHGTGTKLGDPIEIAGLSGAFGPASTRGPTCWLGSVKSNIGHCESAAGIAAVTKVLLQMQHGQLAPSLHAETLNPLIDFEATRFRVVQSLQPWQPPTAGGEELPRIAGVSSFGAGGSNAHLVLREHRRSPAQVRDANVEVGPGDALVVLSARDESVLRVMAQRLLAFLERQPAGAQAPALGSLAYTLQVGREAMAERLALVVDSLGALADRLLAYLATGSLPAGVHRDSVPRSFAQKEARLQELLGPEAGRGDRLRAWWRTSHHGALAAAWCAGAEIDWSSLYEGRRPARIRLPSYPFARERHWVPRPAVAPAAAVGPAGSSRGAGKIKLLPTASVSARPSAPLVEVVDRGGGVWSVAIAQQGADDATFAERAAALRSALERFGDMAGAKVVVLQGLSRLAPDDGERAHQLVESLRCALPTIVLLEAGAPASSVLAATGGDLVVAPDAGEGSSIAARAFTPLAPERARVYARFGAAFGKRLLAAAEGMQSRARLIGLSGAAPADADAEAYADELARSLADAPRPVLLELKTHFQQALEERARALEAAGDEAAPAAFTLARVAALPRTSPTFAARMQADGVLRIDVRAGAAAQEGAPAEIIDAIDAAEADAACRAVVLGGALGELRGLRSADLCARVVRSDLPILAAPEGGARDLAWLLAMACDDVVYLEDDSYALGSSELPMVAADLARDHLGPYLAAEVLLGGLPYSAATLAARSPALRVVRAEARAATLEEVLRPWARLSPQRARALKRRLAGPARALFDAKAGGAATARRRVSLGRVGGDDRSTSASVAPRVVDIGSAVVRVEDHGGGVAVVTLADREAKNHFSDALIEGVVKAFEHVQSHPEYRVVVLTGYDSYFACGGTKESLLAVQRGTARFTDVELYDLPLRCPIPVISAMQGHGIGAGWAFGFFADLAILSQESTYESPYLRYGFTPGAGATLILPARLGQDLGREVLFAARAHKGSELAARGVPMPVVPRDQVLARAMTLARAMAARGRSLLVRWKEELSGDLRDRVRSTYQSELDMHERTFVGSDDVLKIIEARFPEPHAPPPERAQIAEAAVPARSAPPPAAPTPQAPAQRTGRPDAGVPPELLAAVTSELRERLAAELQMKIEAVIDDAPFSEMGLDSISGATWVKQTNKRYGLKIETPKVYTYSTLRDFAQHVVEEGLRAGVFDRQPAPAPSPPAAIEPPGVTAAEPCPVPDPPGPAPIAVAAPTPSKGPQPQARLVCDVAVIGMAGRFPMTRDLDQFWSNIAGRRDCIREVPAERWSIARYYDPDRRSAGKTYGKWMGLLEGADCFDPQFFNISPLEAEFIDPQQRVFLQECWHCIEDAGYDPQALWGARCGVFVGCAAGDYGVGSAEVLNAQRFMGSACSILAARIAYFLNLRGPCLSIDTACSSSLVALAQACDSLLLGRCDSALVGGVSVLSGPGLHILGSKAGMLSPDGACRPFDQEGQGFAPGEGVGVVLVKRLEDAVRDGDQIHGVIRGWGINQDGKTNGITAPNADSQRRLEIEVYERCGVNPAEIQLVEAHGTGTKLGDPIEFEALSGAFREFTDRQGFCALGSVKSNIGHLGAAAGIAGLLKVLLALRHRQLPPTIHFDKLNEHIPIEGSPFFINTECREWSLADGRARRAAVSSFGFSGTNAHLVIEEWPAPPSPSPPEAGPQAIVLSAKDPERLRALASRLAGYVLAQRERVAAELSAVAYTLQLGRAAMKHRLALVVTSAQELAEGLTAFVEGRRGPRLYQGELAAGAGPDLLDDEDMAATVKAWIAKRKYDRLVELWVRGGRVDWAQLHGGARPRRVSLPGYCFAEERYWLGHDPAVTQPVPAPSPAAAHPLLGEGGLAAPGRYRSMFRGDEFFLADHVVVGERVLPGVAILEMVRAAFERSAKARPSEGQVVRLENVAWARPFAPKAPGVAIEVSLEPQADGGWAFEVSSASAAGQPSVHCRGLARFIARQPADDLPLDLEALRGRTQALVIDREDCYAAFRSLNIQYGDAFRVIERLEIGAGELLAGLQLPASVAATLGDFVMHPSLVDGCLQSSIGLAARDGGKQPSLPFAVGRLDVLGPCTAVMWAHVRQAPGPTQSGLQLVDIDLCDGEGRVRVRIRNLSARLLSTKIGTTPAPHVRILRPVREELPPAATVTPPSSAGRTIVLCEVPAVEPAELGKQLRGARCLALEPADGTVAERFTCYAVELLERIRGLVSARNTQPALLQVVVPNDSERRPLWALDGILRTASVENPALRAQLVALDPADGARDCAAKLDASAQLEDVRVCHVGSQRQVVRWREVEAAPAGRPWRDDGVYVITGGMGGVGAAFVAEILRATKHGRVVVLGRSKPDQEQLGRLAGDRGAAGRLHYQQVDVVDGERLDAAIGDIVRRHGAIHGVLHSAGVLRDSFMTKKSATDVRAVLAPKVAGTVHLDRATAALELDFFALFSSGVAVAGNVGQADYAAANAFMDAFAEYRDELAGAGKRSGRTVSIGWPYWQDGGMQVAPEVLRSSVERTGAPPMSTAAGIEAFCRALTIGAPHVMVVTGAVEHRPASPAPDEAPPPSQPSAPGTGSLGVREVAIEHLRRVIADGLKLPPGRVRNEEAFASFGIDSMIVLQLTDALEATFGPLPKTLFFEYQNVDQFADYLVEAHRGTLEKLATASQAAATGPEATAGPDVAAAAAPDAAAAAAAAEFGSLEPPPSSEAVSVRPTLRGRSGGGRPEPLDIAIVGLSGRYPKAQDLFELWDNLKAGRDCVVEIPAERWKWQQYFSDDRTRRGYHYSRHGGFIDDVDKFDAMFFGVSPKVAPFIDPQERIFLEQVWAALEDAGYRPDRLQGKDGRAEVGVYVGVMASEYQLFGAEASLRGSRMGFCVTLASIANRISHTFNLRGPSMVVDTVCSSSLTAVHLACQDLRSGRIDAAISGGVNLSLHPNKYHMLSMGQFISTRGRCESFGAHGEGYIPAEGVGALLLKRLEDAERDGDRILAVIKGSALNHGGRTYGYNVPNASAQASVISRALEQAGVEGRDVTYIEAHGTGTQLGDPVEIAGLAKAFGVSARGGAAGQARCWVGSVKSNVGHCESAAGIAGITKVVLQMQHRQLVPSLHAEAINPKIDFGSTPFAVNQTLREWDPGAAAGRSRPRIAGVSSFGAGGSNAHLILEEYAVRPPRQTRQGPCAVILSARSAERLEVATRRLLVHLRGRRDGDLELADVAYTLQVGRDAMPHRLAVVVGTIEELQAELDAFIADRGRWHGELGANVKDDSGLLEVFDGREEMQQALDGWLRDRRLPALVKAWVKGAAIDWERLYAEQDRPRRVSLPTYPFERRRFWVTDIEPEMRTEGLPARALLSAEAPRGPLPRAEAAGEAAGKTPEKPSGIVLPDPADLIAECSTTPGPSLVIDDGGGGVVVLRRSAGKGDLAVEELGQAVSRASAAESCKVIVLASAVTRSLAMRASLDAVAASTVESRVPVVASLGEGAAGTGLLVGALCDFAVLGRQARYTPVAGSGGVRAAREVLSLRFGQGVGRAMSLWGRSYSGHELAQAAPGLRVCQDAEADATACRLAADLAQAPREALVQLKRQLSRPLAAAAGARRGPATNGLGKQHVNHESRGHF